MPTGSISDDGRVLVLLCSSIASPRGGLVRPFGPHGWARLAGRLAGAGLEPAALLGMDAAALRTIAKDEGEARDIAALLARSGQLAFELERLAARGIGVETLADEAYPSRLRERLGDDAPPVLFVAGDGALLRAGGVAIVGSRDEDGPAAEFARAAAASAARAGQVVVSGGARGVDQLAMQAALDAGGRVAGLVPEGLERRVRDPSTRVALVDGTAVLASPYHPAAGFSAGAAIARNKLIYALADVAVVVASAAESAVESGGTWAGAVEALDAGRVPVFVRRSEPMPPGNRLLLERGALPLAEPESPAVPAGWIPGTPRPAPRPEAVIDRPSLGLLD